MLQLSLLLLSCLSIIFPVAVLARITPEDIVNSKLSAYNQKVKNYSPSNQQKLTQLSTNIADINKKITNQWEMTMLRQGEVLDEYQNRNGGKESEGIKNARYWITYAHEATAYQAAKIYIFDLTLETNIKPDAVSTLSVFQSDLSVLKGKVKKSENILQGLVKNQ